MQVAKIYIGVLLFFKLTHTFSPENLLKQTNYFKTLASAHKTLQKKPFYDVIVIGGGAAGCPLARTLAESGKKTLLIERGGPRSEHPSTLDIYGAGWVIDNRDVSQPVITTDGVRSHIGSVLSGGTGINMGIVISEVEEYVNHLESFPGVSYDHEKFSKALNWTLDMLSYKMPQRNPYGDAWIKGLEKVFGPSAGYQMYIKPNASWHGYSVFSPDHNYFRFASDVTFGTPGYDFPKTLNVLVHHTVQQIEFEKMNEHEYRATCVLYSETTPPDRAPITSERVKKRGMKYALFSHFLRHLKTTSTESFNIFPRKSRRGYYRACVRPEGKIITSAGAILTPLLLYKSGVGPREIIEKYSSFPSLVKDIPELGRGLRDRVFIPISVFFRTPPPLGGYPPTIVQSAGFAYIGNNCTRSGYFNHSESCTAVTAEELSGGRIAEGTLYSTRVVLPPAIRNDPALDTFFQILVDCAQNGRPLSSILLLPLCKLISPITQCAKRVASNFYFTTEPRSNAELNILPDGTVAVTGHYLENSQDLNDAARGLSALIRTMSQAPYDKIFEQIGPFSCPLKWLNGFGDLIKNGLFQSQITIDNVDNEPSSKTRNTLEQVEGFLEKQKRHYFEKSTEYASSDYMNVKGNVTQYRNAFQPLFSYSKRSFKQTRNNSRPIATYPPVIPDPNDEEGLKKFAKTWMTSIWHWVGSAAMGKVVDQNFKVFGFSNLHIVDASVLNQVTRMNPTVNIITLGRYAGLILS